MSLNMLKKESQTVLEYVKLHPEQTSTQITEATGLPALAVTAALYTLWEGNYIHRKPIENHGKGARFTYTHRTDEPRISRKAQRARKNGYNKKRARRAIAVKPITTPVQTVAASKIGAVKVLIAIGERETLVVSADEAREIYRQLGDAFGA